MGVKTYVSPKQSAVNKQHGVFPVEAFRYHPGTDTYRCPAGETLRSTGTVYERSGGKGGRDTATFKHYRTKACQDCPLREQCTTSRNGRVIQRGEHQAAIDRNNKRVWANPEYYRNRQQIIEHQYGTLKR
jgi:hypothetical protein